MSHLKYRLIEIDFTFALKYALEILDNEKSLSKSLCNNWNYKRGKFYSLLPESVDIENLNFEMGQYISKNITENWLINLLINEIKNGAICVFQDYIMKKGDRHLKGRNGIFYRKDEVYMVLNRPSKDRLKKALVEISCIFLDLVIATKFKDLDFNRQAKECTLLGLGAFDGEGYVVWLLN